MPVDPRPIANLKVRELAIVRRPAEGVELSRFECADDCWLVDRDAGERKAAVGPSGKTVGKKPHVHVVKDLWYGFVGYPSRSPHQRLFLRLGFKIPHDLADNHSVGERAGRQVNVRQEIFIQGLQ